MFYLRQMCFRTTAVYFSTFHRVSEFTPIQGCESADVGSEKG